MIDKSRVKFFYFTDIYSFFKDKREQDKRDTDITADPVIENTF